jgi:hypothetical protein
MDLLELMKIAESVPDLLIKIENLQTEIELLKKKPGYKDILTVEDLHELTGFKSSTTIRKLIHDIGNAKYRGKDFVMREDFRDFFKSRKSLSETDIDDIIENYEINRAKKLANV